MFTAGLLNAIIAIETSGTIKLNGNREVCFCPFI